jgi:DNA-binding winged helix-turn-helix (wHTH) protein
MANPNASALLFSKKTRDQVNLAKAGPGSSYNSSRFQILVFLLQRPGEIVTREELREQLWPADTFVDFDHSLNAAIKRLRDALGESAENPIYTETLARRGYRFNAPVQSVPAGTSVPAGSARVSRQLSTRSAPLALDSLLRSYLRPSLGSF